MTSRFRRSFVLACIGALSAGLLVSAPASQAASAGIKVVTSSAAPSIAYEATNPNIGASAVFVLCQSTTADCRGTVQWQKLDGTPASPAFGYVVRRHSYTYMYPKVNTAVLAPTTFDGVKNAQLKFVESGPSTNTYIEKVHIEPRQRSRDIEVNVDGPATNLSDIRVHTLVERGNRLFAVHSTAPLAAGSSSYYAQVPIGTNNSSVGSYRLKISAKVAGVGYREWFWRGADNLSNSGGGTGEAAEVLKVVAGAGPFVAKFSFGTVNVSVAAGAGSTKAKVTVAGASAYRPTSLTSRKAQDLPYCADSYGSETINAGDTASFDFVPRGVSGEKRYAIGVSPLDGNATELWNDDGAGGKQDFGSCLHLRAYGYSIDNLLPFNGATLDRSVTLRNTGGSVSGSIAFPGYTQNIRDVALDVREFIPGVPVLSSPIVVDGNVQPGGGYLFDNLPPGAYYVSVGRKQNCQNWLASRYNNNSSHINEASDRETEAWKSFGRISELSTKGNPSQYELAVAHGATYAEHNKPLSGYAGWMFRDHCRYEGAGGYMRFDVTSGAPGTKPDATASFTNSRGATISGTVRRAGGRTYKEMMVSAYSTQGYLVGRTAISGDNGSFTIRGLQSGNYRIVLNTDSWRGLGRTHSGVQYKSVTRGNSYSVGTLTAYF